MRGDARRWHLALWLMRFVRWLDAGGRLALWLAAGLFAVAL